MTNLCLIVDVDTEATAFIPHDEASLGSNNKPPSQLNHMKGGQGAFDTWVVYVFLLQIDMK